ncbi:conserved exported hypothetical protein [Vibrio coralliirubri]|uniref:hypothetical protein n=1 Tax=Vibrio coralliirubri TaxID=1516159 RepID=UPI0006394E38|nr:hypothetical protein [Vibrio coralliirubri]CDT26397.1 conserved exported hypothetical protein [Vibrio coralliirubri]CDT63356.1 conserved exported hypothetical protein [Vibrio coralliirubri]
MKKVSLLAASVAIALSGCGGSDGGSSDGATPGGIVITGFDGYFKNAVVFDDVGQSGVLEVGTDTIFGLTDQDGKITLPVDTEIDGKLAIKTLRPGDMTKALAEELSALSSKADSYSDFMDVYTTDMDHEGQPMANSVVFRTPEGTDKTALVISPITDLVAIEMQKNDSSFEDATTSVNENLGGTIEEPIDLFSDFVATSKDDLESAQLHKTAQILTESKAQNPTAYENNASSITETASEASKEIVTEENMGSDELLNEKPVIDPTQPENVVTNYKLLVDATAQADIASEIAKLEIVEGSGFTHTVTIPDNLFQDKYSAEDKYESVEISSAAINGAQEITATLEGNVLTLAAKNGFEATLSNYIITLTAEDRATADSSEVLSELSTTFSFNVLLANTAPEVEPAAQLHLQNEITENWIMQQGQLFSAELLMNGLFTDREDDKLTYNSNIGSVVKGLTSKFNAATGKMTISGYPESPTSEIKQFNITADDGHAATFMVSEPASFNLPIVALGDITVEPEVKAGLQKTITDTWTFTVGESSPQQLNISDLFTSNVSGSVEYYANYAANDNGPASNPIPGVSISVDASGLVTLTGTPTAETNGVMLYVAQGINFSGGEENDIESKMVTFALPNVQPNDEIIPPQPELGFTEAHFNNQEWKMGSFADNDGEIGYASLAKDEHGLMFCWGSNSDESYSGNMSDSLDQWGNSYAPFTKLAELDKHNDYMSHQDKDCMDVTLNDGKMIDKEGYRYEMLYQHQPAEGEYQIILKINQDELFWLDSTSSTFSQTSRGSEKITSGFTDFDLTVEAGRDFDPELDGYPLTYAAGKFEYAEESYEYTSIKPTGFYTPGNLSFVVDNSNREGLVLEETGADSDFKTRYRYIQREFGDFYIGVKWSEEPQSGYTSAPEFGLYSYDQASMEKVIDKLPLLQD